LHPLVSAKLASTPAFRAASNRLDVVLGTLNTVILLTSSLTVALGVHAAARGKGRAVAGFLLLTMALGSAFLGIKGIEYVHKYGENLVPGTAAFAFAGADPGHAALFFGFYFTMTGMHALHMLIGILAKKIIEESPAWKPGKQRGIPVRQKMVIQIVFNLN
jgi:cytochrome c oxidase subunit 3